MSIKHRTRLSENEILQYVKFHPDLLLEIIRNGKLEPASLTYAAEYAGQIENSEQVRDALMPLLHYPNPVVREGAIYGLANHIEHIRIILKIVSEHDPSRAVRNAARDVLENTPKTPRELESDAWDEKHKDLLPAAEEKLSPMDCLGFNLITAYACKMVADELKVEEFKSGFIVVNAEQPDKGIRLEFFLGKNDEGDIDYRASIELPKEFKTPFKLIWVVDCVSA